MRAFRASRDALASSTGQAGAHIAGNIYGWMAACTLVAILLFVANAMTPGRGQTLWGDLGALFAALLGILVMMKAEAGRQAAEDDGA